ncbi:hypothetical protein Pfo_000656, partial [Paulownia fortunei]
KKIAFNKVDGHTTAPNPISSYPPLRKTTSTTNNKKKRIKEQQGSMRHHLVSRPCAAPCPTFLPLAASVAGCGGDRWNRVVRWLRNSSEAGYDGGGWKQRLLRLAVAGRFFGLLKVG